jgi:hypothetical protein
VQTKDQPDPRVRGITAALSLNRGELDPAKLERLLSLIEAAPATSRPQAA